MTAGTPVRRPRIKDERAAEMYEAVLDLLREVGYEALTMEAVAARTRSSKATLYRLWGSKAVMTARALEYGLPPKVEVIDTGSLRGDLHLLADLADEDSMRQDSALTWGVGRALFGDPELMKAFREVVITPRMEVFHDTLRRAVLRGEVPADRPALEFIEQAWIGAMVARPLLADTPMTPHDLKRYIDALILPALGA